MSPSRDAHERQTGYALGWPARFSVCSAALTAVKTEGIASLVPLASSPERHEQGKGADHCEQGERRDDRRTHGGVDPPQHRGHRQQGREADRVVTALTHAPCIIPAIDTAPRIIPGP